jgi:heme/copper-type cytochrome/quinol oxidase subunit 4
MMALTYSMGVPGRLTLPHQPFRDELGNRRRSTLSYFYIGVVFSALAFVLAEKLPSFRSSLLALAVVGVGLAIFCLLRFLRSNDEREQQINYRALTFAFTGTLVFCTAIGFLQMFGFHSVSWLGIPALMVTLWSIGLILYSWRY